MVGRPALRRSPRPSTGDLSSGTPSATVPHVTTEPIWSLQPWPVVIDLGKRRLEIPAYPASAWLAVLMKPGADIDDLLLDLVPDSDSLFYEAGLSIEDVDQLCLQLITAASGRSWWIALRLVGIARTNWNTLGADLILHGVDPTTLSLSAWLDALLLLIIRALDPKDVTMFSMQLEAPPPEEAQSAIEATSQLEMSRSEFEALMRA